MATIDVVIPVYRPDEKLERLIRKLYSQTLLPHAVILMVTMTGGGKELAEISGRAAAAAHGTKGAERVSLVLRGIKKEEFSHGRTRNQGIALSGADYVVCMTQDAVPKDCFLLERLLAAFSRYPRVSSVYARQTAGAQAPELVRMTQSFNYPEEDQVKNRCTYGKLGIKNIFCSDVCCMYDRAVFVSLGGFADRVIFNEDMLYARKAIDAGYQVVYAAQAKVEHWHDYTLSQQFRRNFDLAVSQKEHPEVFADLSSEAEGMRMVKRVLGLLYRKGRWGQMLRYVLVSGAKYLGYRAGLCYRRLPSWLVKRCSMTPGYFEK